MLDITSKEFARDLFELLNKYGIKDPNVEFLSGDSLPKEVVSMEESKPVRVYIPVEKKYKKSIFVKLSHLLGGGPINLNKKIYLANSEKINNENELSVENAGLDEVAPIVLDTDAAAVPTQEPAVEAPAVPMEGVVPVNNEVTTPANKEVTTNETTVVEEEPVIVSLEADTPAEPSVEETATEVPANEQVTEAVNEPVVPDNGDTAKTLVDEAEDEEKNKSVDGDQKEVDSGKPKVLTVQSNDTSDIPHISGFGS